MGDRSSLEADWALGLGEEAFFLGWAEGSLGEDFAMVQLGDDTAGAVVRICFAFSSHY